MSSRISKRIRSRAEPVRQGETLLDDPAVHAQAGAMFLAAPGDDWGDLGGPDLRAVLVMVIAAVCVEHRGASVVGRGGYVRAGSGGSGHETGVWRRRVSVRQASPGRPEPARRTSPCHGEHAQQLRSGGSD